MVTTDLASVGLVAGIVTIGLANVANAANGMDEVAVLTPASKPGRFGSATTDLQSCSFQVSNTIVIT
jgi:hypothetical protein